MSDNLQIPPPQGGQAFHSSYRAQSPGMDTGTRRLLLAAVALGGVLLAGTGGWALLGHRSAAVPVIEADTRPVRVKPDNAGGMQVAGSDEPAMGDQAGGAHAMAPVAEAPAPQVLRAQLQPPAPPVAAPALPAPIPPTPATAASVPAPAVAAGAEAAHPAADPARAGHPAARPPAPVAASAAAAPPASTPAAPVGGVKPMVQLAAVDNELAAQAEWQRLAKRMPDVLGGKHPVVQRAERGGHAVWRVRTGGFADIADATDFCARVRAKGGVCTIASF